MNEFTKSWIENKLKGRKYMQCKVCGRSTVNDNANYCEYCGSSYRDNITTNPESFSIPNNQPVMNTNNETTEKTVSFGNWMGSMLLMFIPVIGIFIYLVMMFVWAFGSDTPPSKRNWARASLIVMIISIVLLIFVFTSAVTELMNSGININDYMSQNGYN